MCNWISDLRKLCRKIQIHFICKDKNKFNELFPNPHFHIEGCQYPPFRKDCNKNGGREITCVKQRLIAKRNLEYENITIETVCIEITMSKKMMCNISI